LSLDMRSFFLIVMVVVLAGCASPSTTRLHHVLKHELGRVPADIPNYRCTIGAHRGASVAHRENTMAALRAAQEDPRVAFVEFDVQFTRDRQIVLFHDQSLLRVYGKFAQVGEATYEELDALTSGDITRYEEAIEAVTKPINLEIKSQGDDAEDRILADAIMADLRARGRHRDVMISSISSEVIRYIKEKSPDWPTGQIYWLTSSTYLHFDGLTGRLYERFRETRADYLMLHVANLRNIEDLLRLKPRDKTVMFWDFDDRMYLVHRHTSDRLWVQRDAPLRSK
jgi:glycerophosphoryl diester phosphodiesterase